MTGDSLEIDQVLALHYWWETRLGLAFFFVIRGEHGRALEFLTGDYLSIDT